MRFVAPFAGQAITSQIIVDWAIKKATSIKEIAREKNNSLIGEKPPNLVRNKEGNRCRKSQVCLTFLLLVVNPSTIVAKGTQS